MQCKHVTIYDEEGKFAGWPANNGIWSWGNEIVVGFIQGTLEPKIVPGHKIDFSKPSYNRQSRSIDGGLTWTFEESPEIATINVDAIRPFDGELNFLDPETQIRFVPMGVHAGAKSPFYYSKDRCKTWVGPFETPNMGLTGISARTEVLPSKRSPAVLLAPKLTAMSRAAVAKSAKRAKFNCFYRRRTPDSPYPAPFAGKTTKLWCCCGRRSV